MAAGIVYTAIAYLALGLVFAIAFSLRGVNVVDHAARDAGWGFRLLIVPGTAALWPWMLQRWVRARGGSHGGGAT